MKVKGQLCAAVVTGLIVLGGCMESSTQTAPMQTEVSGIHAQLAHAKSQKDYRLLVFASRRLVIPGFEDKEAQQLKARCGVRYWKNEGDVLYPSQASDSRAVKYQFASDYNQEVYTLCRQATK
ncbi:hypothetical protein L1286_19960 [Pseudoalteromonas sp. SMS1]|uniref:hypothetical protein n=1 Tax=Pseudoalteromonas sp. SMS1 TaxID=2908894 RepID=UPI001F421078|nr:hypothetical protein [Pseudoalteromonas sp. SMS1]MCF2859760.1 hypothetical protein [Pseudoalteromonas sp. SMS1]